MTKIIRISTDSSNDIFVDYIDEGVELIIQRKNRFNDEIISETYERRAKDGLPSLKNSSILYEE